jgi:hypothetical protein
VHYMHYHMISQSSVLRVAAVLTMLERVQPVVLSDILAARTRLAGQTLVTPVVACQAAPAGKTVRLKLESLQSIGSFKLRPIGNAVLSRTPAQLAAGIYTSSSGNSALGVAWMARQLGIKGTAVVPANAPEAKLEKLCGLGARIDMRSVEDWWRAIQCGVLPEQEGIYIDAVRDPACHAGGRGFESRPLRRLNQRFARLKSLLLRSLILSRYTMVTPRFLGVTCMI